MLERYITKNGKKLRLGYTTGSCATAAAKAAAIMLLSKEKLENVCLITPAKIEINVEIHNIEINENFIICSVKKDAGDDPDVTDGMLITAKVALIKNREVEIDGGIGIGRVTKSGLNQPVGNAAINSVPRMMIQEELLSVCDDYDYKGGFKVIISADKGEEVSKRTFNSRLGIIGGISILGTSGIVEPMSESALIQTIHKEIDVKFEEGKRELLLTPGNYGKDYINQSTNIDDLTAVKCSNFIGEAIDYAMEKGFKSILIIGHGGKLIKLAGGLFNTHSKFGDCRAEIIASYSALFSNDIKLIENIFDAATIDAMLYEIDKANIMDKVLEKIIEKVQVNLNSRVYNSVEIGAIIFTNNYGLITKTKNSDLILNKIIEKENK